MDWGPFPERDEDHGDYKIADARHRRRLKACRATSRSSSRSASACRTCRASRRRSGSIGSPPTRPSLPPVKHGDRDDTPAFSWYLHWKLPEPRLSWYEKFKEEEPFVRAYLARTSSSTRRSAACSTRSKQPASTDNTIVVAFGDHG